MSAITRAIQHGQMVKDIEALKQRADVAEQTMAQALEVVSKLTDRLIALEQKRGPGRPKNEDRKPESGQEGAR